MNDAISLLDQRLDSWFTGFFFILPNLIVGAIIGAVFLLIASGASRLLHGSLRRSGRDDLGHVLGSFMYWGIITLAFLVVMTIVLPSMKPADIFTSLGLGSVALGFAFKDILQNWLAGIFILIRRPFHRGDQIKIGDIEGTVQAVETRATLVKTYDGKLVIIPNTDIYTQSVTVKTAYDIRRTEISVPLGMGVDLAKAIEVFAEAAASVEHVRSDPPPDVLPWELRDNNVHLRIRWWTLSQRSYEVRTRAAMIAAIHRAAAEHGIDIPPDDTISFADTPLFVTEVKPPKKPAARKEPVASPPLAKYDLDEARLDAPRDPEAERPKSGGLNEGDAVPR